VAPLQALADDWGLVIPGMRTTAHVEANIAAGHAAALDSDQVDRLRACRWGRRPDDRP